MVTLVEEKLKSQNVDLGCKRLQAKRQLGMVSPYFLGKEIFGYDRFCETQLDWDNWIREIVDFKDRQRTLILIEMPRETLKTTYFSICLPICLLLNDPECTILLANEIYGNAVGFLHEIKGNITSPRFQQLYGNWEKDTGWCVSSIEIAPRKKQRKEMSIETTGLGAAITSKHFDVIICDDIAGTDDRDSSAKREKTFLFFNDIFDVLKRDTGILIVVGTRWHNKDIYCHIENTLAPELRKKGYNFHMKIMPAHDPKTHKLNFPRLLSQDKLDELRVVKTGQDGVDISTFMAQYELSPLDSSTQIFKTFFYYNHQDCKYKKIVQWTDPAARPGLGSCYSAIIVIGQIAGGQYDNRWGVMFASVCKRAPSNTMADHNRIYYMLSDVNPKIPYKVYIEGNGYQIMLATDGIKESTKAGRVVPTESYDNSENKDARILWLEPFITGGHILFRDDWLEAPEGYRLLIEQLRDYRQKAEFKDAPDALQGAFGRAHYASGSLIYTSSQYQREKELEQKQE